MTQAKKEFEKEREVSGLDWMLSDDKFATLGHAFESGYTACLSSSIVKRMEDCISHIQCTCNDKMCERCSVLCGLFEIRGEIDGL